MDFLTDYIRGVIREVIDIDAKRPPSYYKRINGVIFVIDYTKNNLAIEYTTQK